MVSFFKLILSFGGLFLVFTDAASTTTFQSGFQLPDTVEEVTIKYKTCGNLIVLPVSINDTLSVNLILDTGTRNMVLFGRRFKKIFYVLPSRKIQFSGLGNGDPVFGGHCPKKCVSVASNKLRKGL